ncbi:MAG: ABC transporter ATP-binding protein [Bacteroidetes bacterium]|nr:ABC transporter ATP-binding protein [Bacteroidota bacterium]MBL6944098.1 ABC transporter ATP-binding protein [Bacteroidales bacterium]
MNISIQRLSKVYDNGRHALSDISLEIGSGMFGLLGPNGAGKSTLMRILVTLMKPTTGRVFLNGKDFSKNRAEIREMLGYLPQDFRFFTKLRTWEFLDYAARLSGIKNKKERLQKVDMWLEKVGLFDVRERNADKLSGGMKRRLGIAQALIGDPKILVVDEPTTGLDPEERIRFRNILSDISRHDAIIILSTHIVGDISSICQGVALLDNGKLSFNGSPEKLIEKAVGHVWQISTSGTDYDILKNSYPVISTIPTNDGWDVQFVADSIGDMNAVEIEPTLEHAYVYFMEYLSNNNLTNDINS